jgi:transcriptional antiterminator RfaH
MQTACSRWYLVRTKQYKEAAVQTILSNGIAETFLPRLRSEQRMWGRLTETITPLFPCYLFASFNAKTEYHSVRRTCGVVGVLCTGDEPLEVDEAVIVEIKNRGPNGVVELSRPAFNPGEPVNVVAGPLRGISAVFDHYLSGSERAALLVDLIGRANVRVILPARLLAAADKGVA